MFVAVNVSFKAYPCHEVHFFAKFMQSRTYAPNCSMPGQEPFEPKKVIMLTNGFGGMIHFHKTMRADSSDLT